MNKNAHECKRIDGDTSNKIQMDRSSLIGLERDSNQILIIPVNVLRIIIPVNVLRN